MDVAVSGWMEGEIQDWPANIQDVIYAALENVAHREKLPLVVVHSRCDIDHDLEEGAPGYFYVHVVASEVVVADSRDVKAQLYKELPEDIRKLMN